MNLEREQVVGFGDRTNPPSRWNHIDTSGVFHPVESSKERRLWEIRFGIQREGNREKKERSQETDRKKTDSFEPFVDPNDPLKPTINKEGELFVNLYGGAYSQNMELNRKGIERTLRIAHLDGQVFLSSFSPNRQRSIEANPDGSVSGKGSLMLGEKIEDEKDNPLYKAASIPQGWRIEVNDQKLTEELTDKKLSAKDLQRAFIRRVNGILREALFECIWKEKLSGIKDQGFGYKLLFSPIFFGSAAVLSYLLTFIVAPSIYIPFSVSLVFGSYACFNLSNKYDDLAIFTVSGASLSRKADSIWEYFMPPVEIDKVGRAFAYLQVKGRRLVRETREEK